jgi:hypothetical protein
VSVMQRLLGAGVYGALVLACMPAAAQVPRKAKEPPPPLDASIPPAVAHCGMAYGNALSVQVRPAMAADLSRAGDAISAPSSAWPGRWLMSDPTGKQAKADALAAAEARTQERICTEPSGPVVSPAPSGRMRSPPRHLRPHLTRRRLSSSSLPRCRPRLTTNCAT